MSETIIHKKSSVPAKVPVAGDLELGEIAINVADKKLYIKDTTNTVVSVADAKSILPDQTSQSGKVLTTNGTSTTWETPAGGAAWGGITGTLADQTDLQTELSQLADDISSLDMTKVEKATVTTKGDILAATDNATIDRLGVGSNWHVLTADSTTATGLKWAAPIDPSKLALTMFGAKGDIVVANAVANVTNLAVGSDGQVLTADSTTATGVKWAAAAGGGGDDSRIASYPVSPVVAPACGGTGGTVNQLAIGDGAVVNSTYNNSIAIGKSRSGAPNTIAIGINDNTSLYGAIGTNSIAVGANAKATGGDSIALGTAATTQNAVDQLAIGVAATISGTNIGSIAIGRSYSSGLNSIAIGIGNGTSTYGAQAVKSIAIGYQAKCSGSGSVAIGQNTISNSSSCVAIGASATTGDSIYSIAIGASATTSAAYTDAIAIGGAAQSTYSICIGRNSSAGYSSYSNVMTIGPNMGWGSVTSKGTITISSNPHSTTYSCNPQNRFSSSGTSTTNSVFLLAEWPALTAGTKTASSCTFIGTQSGINSSSTGSYFAGTVAIGMGATVGGDVSNAENSIAIGSWSNARGSGTVSIGSSSAGHGASCVGIGDTARAGTTGGTDIAAIAIGKSALASKSGSVAIGPYSKVEFPGEITFDTHYGSTQGDIKISHFPMSAVTGNATIQEFRTGAGSGTSWNNGASYIICANNSTYMFDVNIVGRTNTDEGIYGAWNVKFCFNRGSSATNSTVQGLVVTPIHAGSFITVPTVTADTTNGRPAIKCGGTTSGASYWVADVRMTKVMHL